MYAKQLNNKINTLMAYTRLKPKSLQCKQVSQRLQLVLFLIINLRINYYKDHFNYIYTK